MDDVTERRLMAQIADLTKAIGRIESKLSEIQRDIKIAASSPTPQTKPAGPR